MHHDGEALPLAHLSRDQGDFDVYRPITFLLVASDQLSSLFPSSVRLSVGGSDIYLSAFHSLGSIALNLFVCVVNSVSKCPP